MKKLLIVIVIFAFAKAHSQGPPIIGDKPIMLGGKSFTTKTLLEYRNTERGDVFYTPLMLHYLPTANTLLAVHLPFVNYSLNDLGRGTSLADIKLLGKYQFFRKDWTGKTWRVAAKTIQTLPTGEALDIIEVSTGAYQGYYGFISGYETLKYGISTEIGYNWMPKGTLDDFRAKLGFGLPLLKPQYPNKQLNLYFEYSSVLIPERDWYQLLYAQGVQYALKNVTFDLSIQLPLAQNIDPIRELNYSLFAGTRYTF